MRSAEHARAASGASARPEFPCVGASRVGPNTIASGGEQAG